VIDRAEFLRAWGHIVARFNRPDDPQQAAAYYGFLSEQMDTAGFLSAARALWATAKWFPRPADFLLLSAQCEWDIVLSAVEEYTPPHGRWHRHWIRLTPRAMEACRRLGGVSAMRPVFEHDVLKLKAAWEQSYEQAIAEEALALPGTPSNSLSRGVGSSPLPIPHDGGGMTSTL
jgi:hypothetical protein